MHRYGTVYADLWMDADLKKLSPMARLVYLYLLSSPHSNIAGYYRLPTAYAIEDLGISSSDYEEALKELGDHHYVYSEDGCILIRTYLKYNRIVNEKQAKGAWSQVERLPLNQLTVEFVHSCIEDADSIIQHIGSDVLRFLLDNHTTLKGIDISPRLRASSDIYNNLFSYKNK